jgi:hypothetical protein
MLILGGGIMKENYLNKDVEMRVYSRNVFSQKIIVTIVFFVFIGFFVISSCASNRYVNHGDGTVTDTNTGLMWASKDNGSSINWQAARSYCQSYKGGGHHDWRMPTIAELVSLYDPNDRNRRGYHVTKLIDTSAASSWASETRNYQAARFNFTYGQVYWLRQSFSGPTGVLPVRSGK